MGIFCGEKGDGMMVCFCNPLSTSITGEAMLIHDYDFCFYCYTVKKNFNVATEYRTYVVGELLQIFQEHSSLTGVDMTMCLEIHHIPCLVYSANEYCGGIEYRDRH